MKPDLYFDYLHLQIININNSSKASLENSSPQWAIFLIFLLQYYNLWLLHF